MINEAGDNVRAQSDRLLALVEHVSLIETWRSDRIVALREAFDPVLSLPIASLPLPLEIRRFLEVAYQQLVVNTRPPGAPTRERNNTTTHGQSTRFEQARPEAHKR